MDFLSWLKGIFGRRGGAEQKLLTEPSSEEKDPRLSKTKEELCAALDEANTVIEKLKRAYADEINSKNAFQKRLQKEQTRKIDEARAKVLRELLDLSDEMDMALSALREESGPLAKGVRMIHDSLKARLNKNGVSRMELVGTAFDPNTAEAMSMAPADAPEKDGVILEVLRPGFTLNGIVIREARVCVAKWTPPPEPEAVESQEPQQNKAASEEKAAEASSPDASAEENASASSEQQDSPEKIEQKPAPSSASGSTEGQEAQEGETKNNQNVSDDPVPPAQDLKPASVPETVEAEKAVVSEIPSGQNSAASAAAPSENSLSQTECASSPLQSESDGPSSPSQVTGKAEP